MGRAFEEPRERAQHIGPRWIGLNHDDVSTPRPHVVGVGLTQRLGEDCSRGTMKGMTGEPEGERSVEHHRDRGALVPAAIEDRVAGNQACTTLKSSRSSVANGRVFDQRPVHFAASPSWYLDAPARLFPHTPDARLVQVPASRFKTRTRQGAYPPTGGVLRLIRREYASDGAGGSVTGSGYPGTCGGPLDTSAPSVGDAAAGPLTAKGGARGSR